MVLRAARNPTLGLIEVRATAGQGADVGEQAQAPQFPFQHGSVVHTQVRADDGQAGGRLFEIRCGCVVSRKLGVEGVEQVPAALLGVLRDASAARGETDHVAPLMAVLGPVGLDLEQRGPCVHLQARTHEHLSDPAGEGCTQRRLHLHRLDHHQRVARLHDITDLHRDRNHDRRRRCSHDSTLVAGDRVADAVHLHQVTWPLHHRGGVVGTSADREPPLETPQPLETHLHQGVAIGAHPVGVLPDARDAQVIQVPAVAEADVAVGVPRDLGAAPRRRGVEACLLDRPLDVVCLERRLDEGDVGVVTAHVVTPRREPVEPSGVEVARDELRVLQQSQQERLVGHAAVDHHLGPGYGAGETGPGLLAVATPRDHLGHHRIELGCDLVALGHPGLHPDAGTRGRPEVGDPSRRRGEVPIRVLGVEPHFDRMTLHSRGFPLEATAAGHVQLELHEVGTGGELRDGVLDLEPRVHLHEPERSLRGGVEELHGAGIGVAGLGAEPGCRRHDLLRAGRIERRGVRLLDHLLVAPLDRAVADPDRPHGPPAVRDHLDLDVAGVAEPLL